MDIEYYPGGKIMDFSINSKFYQNMSKIADMMILSILWLLTSLPLITIGSSSCALYYCIVKVIREDRGTVMKDYIHSFKSNFKQSFVVSLLAVLLCVAGTAIGSTAYAIVKSGEVLTSIYFVYLVALGFGIAWLHYVISYIARFHASLKTILKNTLVICLINLPASISMMLLFMVVVVVWLFTLPASAMTILLLPAVYALISSFLLERIYQKYISNGKGDSNDA